MHSDSSHRWIIPAVTKWTALRECGWTALNDVLIQNMLCSDASLPVHSRLFNNSVDVILQVVTITVCQWQNHVEADHDSNVHCGSSLEPAAYQRCLLPSVCLSLIHSTLLFLLFLKHVSNVQVFHAALWTQQLTGMICVLFSVYNYLWFSHKYRSLAFRTDYFHWFSVRGIIYTC